MKHRLIRPLLLAAALYAGAAQADLSTYTMVAKDGRLTPATLAVPAGVRFKIVIRNEGREPVEFESLQLRKEKVLAPGARSFVVIAPLKPGEYDFFDEFHPDTSKGRIVAKLKCPPCPPSQLAGATAAYPTLLPPSTLWRPVSRRVNHG